MTSQIDKAQLLKKMHVKGNPLILFNCWDAGSAQALQEIGAKAIGTSSWSVAASYGYEDGEKIPCDLVLSNLKCILNAVHLPVTIDIEAAYAKNLIELEKFVSQIIQSGVAGINFEDQIIGTEKLYAIDEQCLKIRSIRNVSEKLSVPLFINARTDIFFKNHHHHSNLLEEAIKRSHAYAEAGADGFFVPGLEDLDLIEKLCQNSPIPINVMISLNCSYKNKLSKIGASRISYGPHPYCHLINSLKELAKGTLNFN